jgi:hypothetical protein
MSAKEFKAIEKLSAALADMRLSPAVMALQLTRENTFVQESFIGMFTNYVITMANKNVIPVNQKEIYDLCVALESSLSELGLTGAANSEAEYNEYLSV